MIPFADALKGVPELVDVSCRDVVVKDLEDITICHIGGVVGIQVWLVWRDLSGLEDEFALRRGDVRCSVIFNLAPVILVTVLLLQSLCILFVVEYTTPDLLGNIEVTELIQARWHHGSNHWWSTNNAVGGGYWIHWRYLEVTSWRNIVLIPWWNIVDIHGENCGIIHGGDLWVIP